MAVNVSLYDLIQYPDNPKTVSVDCKQVVPLGAYGDEKWVITATTTATASGSASIQDIIIRENMLGWCRSNGVNQGPYTVSAAQCKMRVSLNRGAYREITLTVHPLTVPGATVAADMQSKIQELSITGGLEAGNLAFKNAVVEFDSGKFTIKSGTTASSYTGSSATSALVLPGSTYDVSAHLGFFAATNSYTIASNSVSETYLTYGYVAVSGSTYMDVYDESVATAGDCFGITDGTNTEYRYVSSVVSGKINFNAAMTNNYAAYSRVQTLRLQDPESEPVSVFETIDDAVRHAIASIANQIDFS
jgi:hypothetical protein